MGLVMTSLTVAGLAAGAAFGGAVVLLAAVIAGWRPQRSPIRRIRAWCAGATGRRMGCSVGAALVVAVLSRWPVAAVAAGAAVWAWPALFGAGRHSARQIERLEALVTWTESLRDTIAGAVSLEQAIPRSIDAAAPAIREPLQRLVALVGHRVPLPLALARFARELHDPTAEQVVASLLLNARLHGPGLASNLTELAATAREELEMRRRIEESRKALRRSVRVVVGVIAVFVAAVSVFSRQFVAPYGTAAGQLVLTGIITAFTLGLLMIRRAATIAEPERFLADEEQLASIGLGGDER